MVFFLAYTISFLLASAYLALGSISVSITILDKKKTNNKGNVRIRTIEVVEDNRVSRVNRSRNASLFEKRIFGT